MSLDKFISRGATVVTPCAACRHKHRDVTCDAFPSGIPEPILRGEHLHREKYPGQENDFLFEPADSSPEPKTQKPEPSGEIL